MNVAKRARNEGMDDGRYSAVRASGVGGAALNVKGRALRVRVAARARIAERWGVLFDRDANWGFACLGFTPYLARAAYKDRPVCAFLLGGAVASTAASSDWNASASFLFVAVARNAAAFGSVVVAAEAPLVVASMVQKRERSARVRSIQLAYLPC